MFYNEPRTFTFSDPWTGRPMLGFFKFDRYWFNKRIAIEIWAKEKDSRGKEDFYEPYCSVTVNLPNAKLESDNVAFIDVNNAPWLEGFLADNGFGLPTGVFRTSGYVNYPKYLLNLKTMRHYTIPDAKEAEK